MEPLSALGVAGNLIQFVQFAYNLSKGTARIYHSADGISGEASYLDKLYSKLYALSCNIEFDQKQRDSKADSSRPISKYSTTLSSMASDCKDVCKQLLESIDEVRVKAGKRSRRWQSFRKALLEAWQADKVNELEKRIERLQSSMIASLCSISGYVGS